MAENIEASEGLEAQQAPPPAARRGFWRTVVLPILVIAAIAGAIWWLEYQPQGETSSTGERFGPVGLPTALVPPGAQVAPGEGDLAPDFLLETLDGGELRLSDLRGQAVVLNFWATWCAPCRKEMPQLVAAYDRHQQHGLVVVGVNLQENKGIIRDYAEDFGMQFPIAVDRDGRVADQYRLLGLPTTLFVDRDGVVRSVFTGPFVEEKKGTSVQGAIEESELEVRIEEVLGAGHGDG